MPNNGKYETKKWIFNPVFSQNFFSLVFNDSIHTVLKKIKFCWGEIAWFWSVCLVESALFVNYHRVISELEKIIDDKKLIHEVWKMFKSGIISFGKPLKLSIGAFHENILSLFCAMLYCVV